MTAGSGAAPACRSNGGLLPAGAGLAPAVRLAELTRGHRARLGWGLLATSVVAATGALYAYLTGPLLSLLLSGGGRGRDGLAVLVPGRLIDLPGGSLDGRTPLLLVGLLLCLLALIKGSAQLGQALLLDGTAERIGHQLRVRLYEHLLLQPLGVQRARAVGDLLARLLDDVRRVQEATVGAAVGLARDGLAALALLVVAVWVAPRLALLALVVLPAVGIVVGLVARRVRRTAQVAQAELGLLSARAAAGLAGLREVKSCGAERRELEAVAGHSRSALAWARRRIAARATGPLVNEVLAATGLAATLLYAAAQVAAGGITPERVVSFFTAVLLLYRPIKGIGNTLQTVAAGRASVARVAELLAQPAEDQARCALPRLQRQLEARALRFRYPDGDWELQAPDLVLEVGRVVALAGPSGSGKTTLANLICGLTRPAPGGQLLWDGIDLAGWPLAALRAQVALVPQVPLLFAATLRDNLCYGAPDATDDAIGRALEATALHGWVSELPRGLETAVGPGAGQELSVGQLQRLAVARALLRRTGLLVLDEPTSALDEQSARQLRRTLRAVADRGTAVLVVAHGQSLLALADEVVWIGGSRVAHEDRLVGRLVGRRAHVSDAVGSSARSAGLALG